MTITYLKVWTIQKKLLSKANHCKYWMILWLWSKSELLFVSKALSPFHFANCNYLFDFFCAKTWTNQINLTFNANLHILRLYIQIRLSTFKRGDKTNAKNRRVLEKLLYKVEVDFFRYQKSASFVAKVSKNILHNVLRVLHRPKWDSAESEYSANFSKVRPNNRLSHRILMKQPKNVIMIEYSTYCYVNSNV